MITPKDWLLILLSNILLGLGATILSLACAR